MSLPDTCTPDTFEALNSITQGIRQFHNGHMLKDSYFEINRRSIVHKRTVWCNIADNIPIVNFMRRSEIRVGDGQWLRTGISLLCISFWLFCFQFYRTCFTSSTNGLIGARPSRQSLCLHSRTHYVTLPCIKLCRQSCCSERPASQSLCLDLELKMLCFCV